MRFTTQCFFNVLMGYPITFHNPFTGEKQDGRRIITCLNPLNSTYQGRTQHAGIEISASGVVISTATSDESGTLINLKSGSYDMQADAERYLPTCTTIDINAAESLTLPPLTLRGGDTNDDGIINIADATLLTGGENAPPADAIGDINNDCIVTIQYFSILGGNYGLEGPLATLGGGRAY